MAVQRWFLSVRFQGQPYAVPAGAQDVPRGQVDRADAELRALRLLRATAHHQVGAQKE